MTGSKPQGGWGQSIGAFLAHYRADWVIRGRASGYTAQHRNEHGSPRGPVLEAPTLDHLAALIEATGQT